MPIKGLTDRGLRFPEIGHIRKGAPKGKNQPGKDLSYFRVEFDEAERKASELFVAAYGEQPKAIRVFFPFDEIETIWDAWLEAYTAGRLVARSDGEKYVYIAGNVGEPPRVLHGEPLVPYVEGQPVPDVTDYKGNPIYCKPKGRLKVLIPELRRAAYLTLTTGSKHDIMNIDSQLEAFKVVNDGKFSGIPFVLRRRPKEISVPRGDNMVRMTMSLISIEADPSWVEQTREKLTAYASPKVELLPAPEPEPRPDENYPWILDDEDLEIAEGVYSEPEPEQKHTRVMRGADGKITYKPGPGSTISSQSRPTKKSWEAWYKLVDKAQSLGMDPEEPKDDISYAELDELYQGLKEVIRLMEEQIPQ